MQPDSAPHVLVPYPAAIPAADWRIEVRLDVSGEGLRVAFRVKGDVTGIRIPAPQPPGPADGLWRHTCFEAFVGVAGEAAYREFNFSPSGQWAAYAFRGYRERDEAATVPAAPALSFARQADGLGIEAEIPAALLPGLASGAPLEIGLAAVLEATDGSLSWWALRHPGERPDFHDRAGFALRLPAPQP